MHLRLLLADGVGTTILRAAWHRRAGAGWINTFEVKPGSPFSALHRTERAGWLESSWGQSENNRRAKFYRLSAAGRAQLELEQAQWRQISGAIRMALQQR